MQDKKSKTHLQVLPRHVPQLPSLAGCHEAEVAPARHHAVDALHLAGPGLGGVVALLRLQWIQKSLQKNNKPDIDWLSAAIAATAWV